MYVYSQKPLEGMDLGEGPAESSFGYFSGTVRARAPRTDAQCRAEERRIRPIVEPPAGELVSIDSRCLANPARPQRMHRDAYAAYLRMKAAAESDGIRPNLLTIVSAYRSVAQQRPLWEAALRRHGSAQAARRWVAPPGASAHHTGRAVDLTLGAPNRSDNLSALRRTQTYRWLVCNAMRFGFFPYAAEPWHWEYTPPQAAQGTPATADTRRPPPARSALGVCGMLGQAPGGLSSTQIAEAAARNQHLSRQLGWDILYDAIASWILGFRNMTPAAATFAQAVADFQRRMARRVDGVLDYQTWRSMLSEAKAGLPRPYRTAEGVLRPNGLQGIIATFGDPTHAGWEGRNIVRITAPAGKMFLARGRQLPVHRLIAPHFDRLFAAIDRASLWSEIYPSAGAYVCRTKATQGSHPCGSPGIRSDQLSNHSWGIAVDFRAPDYPLYTRAMAAARRPLRYPPPTLTQIIQPLGFHWGLWFMRGDLDASGRISFIGADPMHFQFATGF